MNCIFNTYLNGMQLSMLFGSLGNPSLRIKEGSGYKRIYELFKRNSKNVINTY